MPSASPRDSRGAASRIAATIALAALFLGGCGVRGPLKLPPPAAPAATPAGGGAPAEEAPLAPSVPPTERKP